MLFNIVSICDFFLFYHKAIILTLLFLLLTFIFPAWVNKDVLDSLQDSWRFVISLKKCVLTDSQSPRAASTFGSSSMLASQPPQMAVHSECIWVFLLVTFRS